jgi:hypothetical protein
MPFRIDRFARKAFYSAVHATEDVSDSLQRAVFKKKKHKKQPAKIKEDSNSVLEELVSLQGRGRVAPMAYKLKMTGPCSRCSLNR